MGHGVRAIALAGLLASQPAMAAKTWLQVNATWNVPYEDFIAVCDPSHGRCEGSIVGPYGSMELSGYVWASRMEAITYVVKETSIPIDLTGTVYPDGELWYLECDSQEGLCPPEHAIWFGFVDVNKTRLGGSSFSFAGIYRDSDYYPSPGESYVSTLFGYNRGEGTSIFADSSVWIERGQSCTGETDEHACWDAYGYWLYRPVTEPTALALIGIGLAGLGFPGRRRKAE